MGMIYETAEASYLQDDRIVLTLDAGGTNLLFSALKGTTEIVTPVHHVCNPDHLDLTLKKIEEGFTEVLSQIDEKIHAISFAFPGPADYQAGIIGDLPNLPAFRGGVPLGPFLEERFQLPVYINNDANLYVLGEYIFGFLPWVNNRIREEGGSKVFKNLVGLTLGSGFGCGIMIDGQLNTGDNSNGGELWLMRNRLFPDLCTDASVGNEKVRRFYAEYSGSEPEKIPDAQGIFKITGGELPGDKVAAKKAFSTMGQIIGDAIANTSVLIDGMVVIGGGLSGAHKFFMPAVMEELNGSIFHLDGAQFPRIAQQAFFLDDDESIKQFSRGKSKQLGIPFSNKKISYDAMQRIGLGISRLGASRAISLGAYVFAVSRT